MVFFAGLKPLKVAYSAAYVFLVYIVAIIRVITERFSRNSHQWCMY